MKPVETSSKTSPHHRRIRAVFSGEWPDRIPVCEQAFASSVASEILGRKVHTGSTELHYEETCSWLRGEAAHDEFVEQLYQDTVALHRALDLDILFLPWRMPQRPTRQVDGFSILYGDPAGDDWSIWRLDPGSKTYGMAEAAHPPPTFETVVANMQVALAAGKLPQQPQPDPLLLRAVREYGGEFVVAGGCGMAVPMQPGWLEATALEPGLVGEYLDLTVEWNLALLEALHKAGIWLVNGGGDFAFNTGPIYSPRFFEKVMAPRWKRQFDRCRELGMAYIMRSDGNLWPVAEALFGRARPHAYYECDYDAGMRFAGIRKAFPELVLIGNVSCDLLCTGSPEEIRRRTLECIEAAAPRVIAASANSILHGTPVENVMALYNAAKNWRVSTPDIRNY